MTNDFLIPWETKSLIHSAKGILYRSKIPYQHNQPRNYINTTDPDIIYYASAYEIYALNVVSRKRTLIKSLQWKPYCLDVAYGWIGVGGDENGQCAFVSINDTGTGETYSQPHAEVDDLLPLDLDPEYRHVRHDDRRTPQWPHHPIGPRYELHYHDIGANRVNSIKIHVLTNAKDNTSKEVVAVVTNHDRTVRIFSLSQFRLLETLDFPTRMNHASISPDGKLLLAVGDEVPTRNETRAFFCRRVDIPATTSEGQLSYPRYQWHESAEPKLILAGADEDSCFCTAFSPSGHICAVASQSGILTFFDTSRIGDEMDTGDAVIAILKSSKPSRRPLWSGAVRSMCFSPAPWDLFAWAEDQGHVCVVDLRNALQSRQTIELRTESPEVNRIGIHDHGSISEQRQLDIERRFVEQNLEALEAQDHLAAVGQTADYLEMAAERRRIERETGISRDSFHSLSESERQMIDSIGLRRPQGNHQDPSDTTSVAPISARQPPNRHMQLPNWELPPPTPHSHVQSRSTGSASIPDFIRHRNWERSRTSDRSYQPRRRSSVVISNSNSNSNTNAPSFHPSSSLAPIETGTPTLSASPSQLPTGTPEIPVPHLFDGSDPWQTVSDAMGAANMSPETIARIRGLQSRNHDRRMQGTATTHAALNRRMEAIHGARERSRAEHADAVEAITNRARETNARISRQMRASRADAAYDDIDREILSRRLDEPRRRTRNEEGVVTMGIGWSVDGRNLFVGTEEGILEYPVNIDARKTFPGIAFL